MKKTWLGLLTASLILGSALMSHALNTGTTTLVIIVVTGVNDIEVGTFTAFNANGVTVGANPISVVSSGSKGTGSMGVRSFGSGTLRYSVSAAPNEEATANGWLQSATATGDVPNKTYRLWGQFRDPDQAANTYLPGQFADEDLLTTTAKQANATVFALDAQDVKFKGYGVKAGQFRNMFFRLDLPSAAQSVPGELGVKITVTATTN